MIKLRPLRNEEDYDWALAELARAFDDQPAVGSLDGHRFERLAALIAAYEDEYHSIPATDRRSATEVGSR